MRARRKLQNSFAVAALWGDPGREMMALWRGLKTLSYLFGAVREPIISAASDDHKKAPEGFILSP